LFAFLKPDSGLSLRLDGSEPHTVRRRRYRTTPRWTSAARFNTDIIARLSSGIRASRRRHIPTPMRHLEPLTLVLPRRLLPSSCRTVQGTHRCLLYNFIHGDSALLSRRRPLLSRSTVSILYSCGNTPHPPGVLLCRPFQVGQSTQHPPCFRSYKNTLLSGMKSRGRRPLDGVAALVALDHSVQG